MNTIQARTKSVRELLNNVKYSIDFYQREYVWERRHIEELLDDFEGRFCASYSEQHERWQAASYPHYFLGTIITVRENNQTYIVDGQQRLTTLTLLLIHILHIQDDDKPVTDVRSLIFSESYGNKSFNINVPERVDCMRALFENNKFNAIWKRRIRELTDIGIETKTEEDESFFKIWLRAKYAETIREHKKGAPYRDFENINKFHRWVRDNKKRVGLYATQDFYDFITQRMNRFAGHYIAMRKASLILTAGREEIYYNAWLVSTFQYMLALAPLRLEDDSHTVAEKIRLVTTFLDIYLARRIVNFRRIGYNTLQYAMFSLAKTIRDMDVSELRVHLRDYLDSMDDTFYGINEGEYGPYYLTRRNRSQIRFLLARMTAWIEGQSGNSAAFDSYLYDAKGRPFQIEHIWADKYERHQDEFASEADFQYRRNYFGGLLLLPRGTNQSLGAASYEEKVQHYLKENLLAASLHPQTCEKNPNFTSFVRNSGLPFHPHVQFKQADLDARQELYRQICEQIWNPARLE